MLVKIADALSNEQFNFPGFTGDNLEWVFQELGLHINHKQKVTLSLILYHKYNQQDF